MPTNAKVGVGNNSGRRPVSPLHHRGRYSLGIHELNTTYEKPALGGMEMPGYRVALRDSVIGGGGGRTLNENGLGGFTKNLLIRLKGNPVKEETCTRVS